MTDPRETVMALTIGQVATAANVTFRLSAT